MPKDSGGKKDRVAGVRGAGSTSGIQKTDAVSGIEQTKKAAPVSGVRAAGAAGALRGTRAMSLAERAHLFDMIHTESDKLFASKNIPPQHKEIVEKAVKMTIDAALLEEEEKNK